jgi:hypothetical protein
MKLLLPLLLLTAGRRARAATPLSEAERWAVVATRVEAACRSVE